MAGNLTISHVSHVRALYKGILRLHRGLPLKLQAIGDQYVKDEFRRHKNVPNQEAEIFMTEWTKYYLTLARQVSKRKKTQTIGINLSPELADCFNDDQATQLMELFKEATKQHPKTS